MKINSFVWKVIEADAYYFYKKGFIGFLDFSHIVCWLNGATDQRASLIAAGWLLRDAGYIEQVQYAAARLVWPLYPLVLLACKVYRGILLKAAKKLADVKVKETKPFAEPGFEKPRVI